MTVTPADRTQPTPPVPRVRGIAALLTLLVVLGSALVTGATFAGPAAAAGTARVTVLPAATADPEYATTLQLRGSGFQSVPNGFGGIYVFFGWVDGSWRPSQGGESGVDYVYVQDSEAKDNRGFQRFVAFPGDPTGYAANGGLVSADGRWATELVIPGATFPARGRSGAVEQIDCRTRQCGIITIGGHGVVNANNETFTPISFGSDGAAGRVSAPPAAAAPSAAPSTVTTTAPAAATPAVEVSAEPVAAVRTTTSVALTRLLIGIAVALMVVCATILVVRRKARRARTGGRA